MLCHPAAPGINQRDVQPLKIPDIAGCQRHIVGFDDAGDMANKVVSRCRLTWNAVLGMVCVSAGWQGKSRNDRRAYEQ